MRKPKTKSVAPIELIRDDGRITRAVRAGAQDALRLAIAHGQRTPAWKDGKVVWVDPADYLQRPARKPKASVKRRRKVAA